MPVRENVESLSFAIVLALVLKYFALEAYQIPTSSMQPALMGSKAAGVFDRILVDKLSCAFRTPQRFDIAVFRYPLNTAQNYVKRIWGLGGETLMIESGNVYRKVADNGILFEAVRKPDHIQDRLWQLVYDSTLSEWGTGPIQLARDFFLDAPGGKARADGQTLVVDLAPSADSTATFVNSTRGVDRLRNHYWHAYPARIQEPIIATECNDPLNGQFPVQDLRLSLHARTGTGTERIFLRIKMTPESGGPRTFTLELDRKGGRIVAEMDRQPAAAKAEFQVGIAADADMTISLAHVDDELVARVGGRVVGRFDYRPVSATIKRDEPIGLSFGASGTGRVTFSEIRIERDIHYTSVGIADHGKTFTVPADHYFMMGDNTMASEDGRLWAEMAFKVDDQGQLFAPDSPAPGRLLRGNRRPVATQFPPDPDENPVVVRKARKVVFTDSLGEEHVFPWNGQEWNPPPPVVRVTPVSFVPKADVIGRALLVFWPLNRFGFVR